MTIEIGPLRSWCGIAGLEAVGIQASMSWDGCPRTPLGLKILKQEEVDASADRNLAPTRSAIEHLSPATPGTASCS